MNLSEYISVVFHEDNGWSVIGRTGRYQLDMWVIEDVPGQNPKRYYCNPGNSRLILCCPIDKVDIFPYSREFNPGDQVFFKLPVDKMSGEYVIRPGKYLWYEDDGCIIAFGENIQNEITVNPCDVVKIDARRAMPLQH